MEEIEKIETNMTADASARELFFKRNERAAVRTLYELEKEAGAAAEQNAESVLENVSALVRAQREEFGTRQCRYVPLAVMRNVWMVKTSGHGRELSEETTYCKDTDTVSATVVLCDGFGGEYRTTRERPVDRSGFDTEVGQILRAKDLIRGTAWSACYASVQANNGYSKVYLDDAEGPSTTETSKAPAKEETPKKKTRQSGKATKASADDALATATATSSETAPSPALTAPEQQTSADHPAEKSAKAALVWPEKPLREVTYEQALATPSPFLKWKLSIITGIGEKPGVGNRSNALAYIEKALSHGETFEDEDVNAMLTIIMHNDDLREAYERRRKEFM